MRAQSSCARAGSSPAQSPLDPAHVLRDVLRELGEEDERLRLACGPVGERDVAGLQARAVAQGGAGAGRQLEPELGLAPEVARELSRAQEQLRVERVLGAVAAH